MVGTDIICLSWHSRATLCGTPHSQVAGEDAWTEKGDHATREAVVTTRELCNVPSSAAWAEARLKGVEKERGRKV